MLGRPAFEKQLMMLTFRVPIAIRTGWLAHLSAARLAGVPATRLAQHHPPPQVTRELAQLLGPGHRLVEVGQELADRAPSCHIASPRFVLDERSAAILFKPLTTGKGHRRSTKDKRRIAPRPQRYCIRQPRRRQRDAVLRARFSSGAESIASGFRSADIATDKRMMCASSHVCGA
jgi:hypothetical protein